MAVNGRRLT